MGDQVNTPENSNIDSVSADISVNAGLQDNTETLQVDTVTLPADAGIQPAETPSKKPWDKARKRKAWFWPKLVCFTAICLIVLTLVVYILTPKYTYGICALMNYYYNVPKGTVDILAAGTSLTYTDLNTNILWDEYGLACYDLSTAEQPYWSTYYYLKEAFRIQKPKMVLLDLKAMSYLEDKVDRTRTVLCSFGILDPVNRLKCIYECVEPEEFLGYALAFPQIHTNYTGFVPAMLDLPPTNGGRGPSWKGYIEKNELAEHDPPAINFAFKTPKYVNEHESEYFRKCLELCIEEDVPVMLIGYPNADYKHDHLYYCAGFEIAEEYGITGINYNLPENQTGINYYTDCADWQHLNVGGSVIFSRAVGEDLREMGFEDHRGDPAYASYDESAKKWFEDFPEYKR